MAFYVHIHAPTKAIAIVIIDSHVFLVMEKRGLWAFSCILDMPETSPQGPSEVCTATATVSSQVPSVQSLGAAWRHGSLLGLRCENEARQPGRRACYNGKPLGRPELVSGE